MLILFGTPSHSSFKPFGGILNLQLDYVELLEFSRPYSFSNFRITVLAPLLENWWR